MTTDFLAIEAAFDALGESVVADPDDKAGCDVTYTDGCIADWKAAAARWASHGEFSEGAVDGFAYAMWEAAQAKPGQRRRTIAVLEIAPGRVAVVGGDK